MNHPTKSILFLSIILSIINTSCFSNSNQPMHTFNGADDISLINVYVVYYVAREDKPLPDWKERINYHLRRIEKFHQREFGQQTKLQCTLWDEPVIASATKGGLPQDDVNRFFFESMDEIRKTGKLPMSEDSFSILLVMADMNFCPGYDDWTRECDPELCICDNHDACSGHVTGEGEDRPGTCCGGSRAIYWPEQHIGLGLVTADGWRVPMKGTDCVAYHEGVGHSIGLPHPEPANNSVMSLAQYVHNINKSWVDEDQKLAMGWQKKEIDNDDLFSTFTVTHEPKKPQPNKPVKLIAELPSKFEIESITAEIQKDLWKPFKIIDEPEVSKKDDITKYIWTLPILSKDKGLAYRVKIKTTKSEEEIWGYYKVRED